ncbi:anthrone oxygenase family protein [Pseudonocardia sp. CA-107938]|uniref:anthrone oxygenase family protein n=1 Tax=Pseudonocardia sp. CA-107938 TaxID=3240021 RepID=UPI003D911CD9
MFTALEVVTTVVVGVMVGVEFAVWAVTGWDRDGIGLVVGAGALLLLSVIMSILLLVPINNRGKTWTPDNRPADRKEQLRRWDRFHYVRVAVIVAAFALLAAART